MGTTSGFTSKAAAVHYADNNYNLNIRILETRTVGRCRWQLLQHDDGRKTIAVALIDAFRAEGISDWGVKFVDETMGPSEVSCPLSFIDAADATGPSTHYGIDWRAKVRAHHAAVKAAPLPTMGMAVQIGGHEYTLVAPWLGKGSGWIIRSKEGRQYRAGPAQLKRALVQLVQA